MDLNYCCGDDGRAYYAKGHVPFADFMSALRLDVGEDDSILLEQPIHCWMRVCRDFQEGHAILVEAAPESRGSFRATWIQDD